MSLRIARTAAITVAAAVLGSGALVTASTPTAEAATAPVSGVSILTHLDLTAGQLPENVTLDRNGSIDVTFAAARQVARITADGTAHVLATLPAPTDAAAQTPLLGFPLATGLVRDGRTFYVAYATGTTAETGIWKFTEGQQPRKFADLPASTLPNGLVMNDKTGVLYVTESVKGAVYSIATKGREAGQVSVFSNAPAVASAGYFGANGIKIRHQNVYVSNLDKGTIVRSPLTGPRAGTWTTVAAGLVGIDDFAFTGKGDEILAGLVTKSTVELISDTGAATTVLTAADGLSNGTSVAVRGSTVYVTSAAYTTQKDPNVLTAHLAKH